MKGIHPVTHLTQLFHAMIGRQRIVLNHNKDKDLYIQRINLDGEVDIYSKDKEEIVFYDVNPDQITIHEKV